MIIQHIDLNMIPSQAPVVVNVDQYDTGTGRLVISLYEDDAPYTPANASATIQGTKPDGHGFTYSVTLSGNTVTANVTEQMTPVAGDVRTQVVVRESTGRTGTFAFILRVQKSALPDDADMSESDYPLIMDLIETAETAASDAASSARAAADGEAWAVGQRNGQDVPDYDPTYHNNAKYYSQMASQDAEAWAVGKRNGQDVPSSDPTYHNNSEWWSRQAQDAVEQGIVDMTGATSTTDGTHGAAVQPVAGDEGKFLRGDATWSDEEFSVPEVSDSTPYLYRQGKATGGAYDTIIGGSIAWNQLIKNGDFSNGTTGWDTNRVSISASNNVCTVTASGAYTSSYISKSNVFNGKESHVFYASGYFTSAKSTQCGYYIGENTVRLNAISANTRTRLEVIQKAKDSLSNTNLFVYINLSGALAANDTVDVENIIVHDLTLMFGATIADYIYALETAEAGSGIAWIKSYGFFTKDYYAYDAGSLLSVNTSGHKLTGKNLFKKTNITTGKYVNKTGGLDTVSRWNYSGYIRVIGGQQITISPTHGNNPAICWYDKNKTFINGSNYNNATKKTVTLPLNAVYVRISVKDSDLDTAQLEYNSTPTTYQPYTENTYPLTPTDLRGTLSLSGDELVYDGDVYESDGTETVKYGYVDLGTLTWQRYADATISYFYTNALTNVITKNQVSRTTHLVCSKYLCIDDGREYEQVPDKSIFNNYVNPQCRISVVDRTYSTAEDFKTAMDGVYLVYPLETPTTATLSPFVSPQICDKDGTEEYIDTRDVPMPVGHKTDYYDIPGWMDNRYFNDLREYPEKADKEIEYLKVLKVSISSVSSLPQTVSNSSVESDMVVVNSVLSNPAAQTGDWTVSTSSGSLTVSGNISGTTNITLYLMKSR